MACGRLDPQPAQQAGQGSVRQRLARYLAFRQQTWAASVNPYLFLHVRNASTARHVTPWWIRKQLGMSGQLVRLDRIFDEAQTTGGDLRALCDLFGLSVAGAYRCTAVIDRIESPQGPALRPSPHEGPG
jgi:hypothetical protein